MKITVLIALPVVFALGGVMYYAGMFDPLELNREQCGPYKLIYREYRGPYNGVRIMMNNVIRYVHDTLHLQTDTAFAVFYDDPQSHDPDSLRSISGVITDSLYALPRPYQTGVFGRTDAVVGRFHRRSYFSYATGSYKFYEALSRFFTAEKINRTGPVMEIYEPARRSIRFVAPARHTVVPAPSFSGSR